MLSSDRDSLSPSVERLRPHYPQRSEMRVARLTDKSVSSKKNGDLALEKARVTSKPCIITAGTRTAKRLCAYTLVYTKGKLPMMYVNKVSAWMLATKQILFCLHQHVAVYLLSIL